MYRANSAGVSPGKDGVKLLLRGGAITLECLLAGREIEKMIRVKMRRLRLLILNHTKTRTEMEGLEQVIGCEEIVRKRIAALVLMPSDSWHNCGTLRVACLVFCSHLLLLVFGTGWVDVLLV